jgi:hypothetical protein
MQPLELAEEYVINTSQNVFLTGKAGTGKTTFLRSIRNKCSKKTVIIAPTAVAAINAGGMTIHSFFQLPIGVFVPQDHYRGLSDAMVTDRRHLLENMRMHQSKRQLIQELDLLIIDEVSMLNADLLDTIDFLLRHIRRNQDIPFGGVQLLFIGDLYQLPPVQNDEAKRILSPYYDSPYFFNALVLQQHPLVYIELDKIYRQSEQKFIKLLNNIRNNEASSADLELLNSRALSNDELDWEKTILLTTHNWKADKINQSQLDKIEDTVSVFEAEIQGEINDRAIMAEKSLQIKVGAQVMFIKNDGTGMLRYYNGKLATIKRIKSDSIEVIFNDNQNSFELEKETWRNIRYKYNDDNDSIEEEELGTLTQYPIRLAWAVTIHKSQGLTFEKAIIDADKAFAAGQVYVALSRCTTLNGISLLAPISNEAIFTDNLIVSYSMNSALQAKNHVENLPFSKWKYTQTNLFSSFEWYKIKALALRFKELVHSKQLPEKEKIEELAYSICKSVFHQDEVAEKYRIQLNQIFSKGDTEENLILLQQRTQKAVEYFSKSLSEDIIKPLFLHLKEMNVKKKVKQYLNEVHSILDGFKAKLNQLEKIKINGTYVIKNNLIPSTFDISSLTTKNEKVDTKKISFDFYKENKTIQEIAQLRNLVPSTILSHLSYYVESGDIDAKDLIEEQKLEKIVILLETYKVLPTINTIKEKLGNNFGYEDIKIGIAYQKFKQNSAK